MEGAKTEACKEQGGFASAYETAAKQKTSIIDDDSIGLKLDQKTLVNIKDPTRPIREEVANRVMAFLVETANTPSTEKKTVVDVGCAVGGDISLLKALLSDTDDIEIIGIELVGPLLIEARKTHSTCTFTEGDVHNLPLALNSVNVVQCSRLLIHARELYVAIDQMVGVLKPNGLGLFSEGDMLTGLCLYSDDSELVKIFNKSRLWVASMCANPTVPMKAYQYLKNHGSVENVTITPYVFVLDYVEIDAGLTMTKGSLDAQVKQNVLTQDEADRYLQAIQEAPSSGKHLWTSTMFIISFTKKIL
jgi:ubiquinone/menaquinone biosynthesis C-methylase UbiE